MRSPFPLRRRRVLRVLTSHGLVHVVVCRLCGALVTASGIDQHAAVHAASGPNRT